MTLVAAAALSSAISPPTSRHSRAPAPSQPQSQILFTKRKSLRQLPPKGPKPSLQRSSQAHTRNTTTVPIPTSLQHRYHFGDQIIIQIRPGLRPGPRFSEYQSFDKKCKSVSRKFCRLPSPTPPPLFENSGRSSVGKRMLGVRCPLLKYKQKKNKLPCVAGLGSVQKAVLLFSPLVFRVGRQAWCCASKH